MRKMNKIITIYLDRDLADWLDRKAAEGYKKSVLIRRILSEHAKNSGGADGGA
jgi:hypothetical protein